jgi:flagellar secretion chaperone FliS
MTLVVQSRTPTTNTTLSSRKGGVTADPYGLGLTRMLMDGALERIDAARGHLENGEPPHQHRLLQSAIMIIDGLRAELDLRAGGAIAANVDNLYDYMCRRLRTADPRNGASALNEVSHLLEALRSVWMFMPAQVRAASRN